MLFFHGVSNVSHLDLVAAIHFFDDRHMFFFGRIHGVFSEQLHGLAAADQLTAATVKNFDDAAAKIAFVNLKSFCHGFLL